MSFYPDVSPGDPFKPNAKLSNDVRHLVNAAHGFQDCFQKGGSPGAVRVSVFNATEESIPQNTAVIFTSDAPRGEVLPVKPAPSGTTDFGILLKTLAPNESGSCLLIGTATVTLSGGNGNYAQPSSDRAFVRADAGSARILHVHEDSAVILLGCNGGIMGQEADYDGPFKIEYITTLPNRDIVVSVHPGNVQFGAGNTDFLRSFVYDGGLVTLPYNTGGYVTLQGYKTREYAHTDGSYIDYVVDAVGSSATNQSRLNEFTVILGQCTRGGKVTQLHSGNVTMTTCVEPGSGLQYTATGNSGYHDIALTPAISFSAGGVCVTSDLVGYTSGMYTPDYVPTAVAVKQFVSSCVLENMSRLIDANALYSPFESEQSDFNPPNGPTVTANTTSSTNGAVVLTATFSPDTVKKEYSENCGATWYPYPPSGVTRNSNGIVYFRGVDSNGNQSPVTQFAVSNISLEAPPIPTIYANTTAPTTEPVLVTAGFRGGGIKANEYSLDGETWLSYPRGGVTMESNGTVTFRSINSAGLSASRSYTVTNIVSSSS